jgi:hypothetical protein
VSVQIFSTARDAKEFFIERIVVQAQRDAVALSDVERKMLYFSETAWTLPDMAEVNAQFESEYDSGEFEQKIAGIVRNIQRAQVRDKHEESKWNEAVALLRKEDHYLLVLIDSAGSVRPRGDFIKLVLTALAIVCVALVIGLYFAGH